MQQCKSLPGTAVDTLVLTLKLVGYEAKKGPQRILTALQTTQVVKAIETALKQEAEALLKKQFKGEALDAKEAAASLGKGVGKAVLGKAPDQILKEVKSSARYQAVEAGLRELQCAFKRSAIGVWIDENAALLIIAATGIVVGGVTAMYVARSGDVPAEALTTLAKVGLKQIEVGTLKFGLDDLKFVPSSREVGFKAYIGKGKLKAVTTKLSLQVSVKDASLESAGVSYETLWPITTATAYKFTAGIGTGGYDLLLGITQKRDGLMLDINAHVKKDKDRFSYGGAADVKWTTRIDGTQLELKGSASVDRGWRLDGTDPAKTEYAFKVSAAWRF